MMDATTTTLIIGILGGTATSQLIAQIGEGIRQRRKRKYDQSDGQNADIAALKTGLQWVLYDRIRFLGHAYINAGRVDFDDRRVLNAMHKCYHDGLGGNGDLNNLMGAVNDLPLK